MGNNVRKFFKEIPLQLVLFIFIFGCLTCFVNTNNLRSFVLWHLVIESIVERGQIHIDGSTTPGFHDNSDSFPFNGHWYSNKPPGQPIIGSLVYLLLYRLGITYKDNFILATGLVTLLTSVLMISVISVLTFSIVFKITKNKFYSLLTTFFSCFGTLLFPYSGITHHDIYATFFLFLGYYLLFYKFHINTKCPDYFLLVSGFCVGFAFFISYNTPSVMLALCMYVSLKKNLKVLLLFFIPFLVSISFNFIFNQIVFGHPLNFPAVLDCYHGIHKERILSIEKYLLDFPDKIHAFLFSPILAITFFSPIFVISYLCIFLIPGKYFIEKLILLLILLLQFFQPLVGGGGSLRGFGWCQFGPRYLLEATPFTLIGLAGLFVRIKFFMAQYRYLYKCLLLIAILIGIVSIIINLSGSLIGAMYCDNTKNAFLSYLPRIISKDLPEFPFINLGLACIVTSMVLLYIKYLNRIVE